MFISDSKENGLSLYIRHSKSVNLYLRNRSLEPWIFPLPVICKLNGTPIPRVNSTKLLGVQINNRLDCSEHVASSLTKATKSLFFLRRLKLSGATSSQLLRVYTGLLQRALNMLHPYGILV